MIQSPTPHVTSQRRSYIGPLEGNGTIPFEEQPERVTTSTPATLEAKYAHKRNEVMEQPHIQQALQQNEQIKGFCNIAESVLELKLDPVLGAPGRLYAKQCPLSQAAINAADPVIKRWLDTGKIMLAPAGCQYNTTIH